ncbi:MAG: hypothetical protein AB7I19_07375 [Planctomycetota bacterium]
MIAGPILPRTAEGLWNVVQSDAARIEHGLSLLRRELVLDGELVIDALAADAAGRPTLIFLSLVESDHSLASRISEAMAWFGNHSAILRDLVDGFAVRLDLPPRAVVVGFEFTERGLARLLRDRSFDLLVVRVDALRVSGQIHVGVSAVATDSSAGLSPIEDLATPALAPLLVRFADLMQRLDDALVVDGDRYSRTWRCDGVAVVRLERAGREVMVAVPGSQPFALCDVDAQALAVDLATRRYLGILAGRGDWQSPVIETRVPERNGRDSTAGFEEPRMTRESAVAMAAPALDPAEVTADEYEAFFAEEDGASG